MGGFRYAGHHDHTKHHHNVKDGTLPVHPMSLPGHRAPEPAAPPGRAIKFGKQGTKVVFWEYVNGKRSKASLLLPQGEKTKNKAISSTTANTSFRC